MRPLPLLVAIAAIALSCEGPRTARDGATDAPATPTSCAGSIDASPRLRSWLECLGIGPSAFALEEESAFALGRPIADAAGRETTASRASRRGDLVLSPRLPFHFSTEEGGPVVEVAEPDSFVDLVDLEADAVHRVLSIGTPGYILDAVWLSDTRFAVLIAERLPETDDLLTPRVLIYDLASMARSACGTSPAAIVSEDAVLGCVTSHRAS